MARTAAVLERARGHGMSVLVLDNGSYEIKVGHAGDSECTHVVNAMMRSRDRRLWLANTVNLCKDLTGLQFRRPVARGQLYSWELEKAIWDWTWDQKQVVQSVDEFRDTTLLLTEAPGSLPSSSVNTDQIVFEEYEFARYRRCPPQVLAANAPAEASAAKLVIDVGFHAAHCVPVAGGTAAVGGAIRRLDVGGRILTNYLKETVSFRHYNMMEETAILNRMKERVCFVSHDFERDLEQWHAAHEHKQYSDFALGYALPSTHEEPYGHVVESLDAAVHDQRSGDAQVLILENERFSVPEALFDPRGHLGLAQAGLAETAAASIAASPAELQPLLWANVVVCGGTADLPGFRERLHTELRKWAPSGVPVRLQGAAVNSEAAWRGGSALAARDGFDLREWTASREEYLEQGQSYVNRKFASNTTTGGKGSRVSAR